MIADELRAKGLYVFAPPWPYAAGMQAHLRAAPAYNAHVIPQGDRVPRPLNDILAEVGDHPKHGFACYEMKDVLSAPFLFSFLSSFYVDALEYFGEEPLLYSVHAFWKKPAGLPGWHYDLDDRKVMVLFMYGTDILTEADGPHAYCPGTHAWTAEQKAPFHNFVDPPGLPEHTKIYGPAGTCFITDTNGLHNGFNPTENPRLLLWARWGVSDPPQTYINDQLAPVPWREIGLTEKPSETIQRATRLVVNWDG